MSSISPKDPNSPSLPQDTNLPKPVAQARNPANDKIDNIYRNIENEPLVDKIKSLEEDLEVVRGIPSIELDMEEMTGKRRPKQNLTPQQWNSENVRILKELLKDFTELLKTPFGSLGYLVKSDSEIILKLYGIDSDRIYYYKLKGSTILISSRQLENMVTAGGSRRWIGEGHYLYNPAEIESKLPLTDAVVKAIIDSIQKQLSKLQQ